LWASIRLSCRLYWAPLAVVDIDPLSLFVICDL
jgi:hypothetical protein